MKYILILLISISFAQEQDWDLQRGYDPRNDERPVTYTEAQVIAPIGMGETEYNVTWCISREVPDACPNQWTTDEFGRDVFYGCLVYHFHYESDYSHSKYFDSYEEAEKFANKAVEENDIIDVKIDGELILKPKAEWINVDVDSVSNMYVATLSNSDIITWSEPEIDTSKIITCLLNHPAGYSCDYGKTTSESYEHMIQRIDAEYYRLHPRERVVTVGDLFDYAEECYNDTLRLEKYEHYGNEYILVHENYAEMFTERQLNKKGYFYQYRWVNNIANGNLIFVDKLEMEYIFVKEPTMKGVIERLKEKKQ